MSKKNKENALEEAISTLKKYIYTTYEPKFDREELNEAVMGAIVNQLRDFDESSYYAYDALPDKAKIEINSFVSTNLVLVQYRNPFESEFVQSDGNSCLNAFVVVEYSGELYEISFGVDSWNQVWQECRNTYRVKRVQQKTITQTIYE